MAGGEPIGGGGMQDHAFDREGSALFQFSRFGLAGDGADGAEMLVGGKGGEQVAPLAGKEIDDAAGEV